MTIQEALSVLDRPLSDTLAFYHTAVFKGLLGNIPEPSTDGCTTVAESLIVSPTSDLYFLPDELLRMFTRFALQDKQTPYEGVFPAPCMIIFKNEIGYGFPETKYAEKPSSPEGEFINKILVERFNSKKPIGFRDVWNTISNSNKVVRPNVFITTFSGDINSIEKEVLVCDPSIVLVFSEGEGNLFNRETVWVKPGSVENMNSVEANRITVSVQHVLLKKAIELRGN